MDGLFNRSDLWSWPLGQPVVSLLKGCVLIKRGHTSCGHAHWDDL